jgi:very-short-patch-repair endonuclease
MSVLSLVRALAEVQHGAVSRAQLLDRGASRHAIAWAVAVGELLVAAPEVYVVAGSPRTWRQELMVAVLDAGPGACVSHRAAAILLGIAKLGMKEVVEITSPRTRTHRLEGVIVHRPLDLVYDRDVVVIDGIPCTGPLRTLVDLGVSESWLEVWDAIERAIQADLVTHRGCEWVLARLSKQGRTGCGPFRRALDERALKMKAPHPGLLEPRMAGVARRFKLPTYAYQHDVFGDGSVLADFAWLAEKVIVEVKGLKERTNPKKLTEDFEREHRLVAAGWVVLSFTWSQVVRRPKYVADQILQVLGARKPVLPV